MPITLADTRTRVLSVIAEYVGDTDPTKLPDDASLESLGIDSLDHIEMVMALETEFGLPPMPDAITDHMTTVGNTVELVEASVALHFVPST